MAYPKDNISAKFSSLGLGCPYLCLAYAPEYTKGGLLKLLGRLRGHLGDYVAGDSQGKDVAVIFRKLRAVFQFIFLFNPSDFLPLHHSPCIQFLF